MATILSLYSKRFEFCSQGWRVTDSHNIKDYENLKKLWYNLVILEETLNKVGKQVYANMYIWEYMGSSLVSMTNRVTQNQQFAKIYS